MRSSGWSPGSTASSAAAAAARAEQRGSGSGQGVRGGGGGGRSSVGVERGHRHAQLGARSGLALSGRRLVRSAAWMELGLHRMRTRCPRAPKLQPGAQPLPLTQRRRRRPQPRGADQHPRPCCPATSSRAISAASGQPTRARNLTNAVPHDPHNKRRRLDHRLHLWLRVPLGTGQRRRRRARDPHRRAVLAADLAPRQRVDVRRLQLRAHALRRGRRPHPALGRRRTPVRHRP
jgi:hypothetical protein